MRMPSMPESLAYAVAAAIGITMLTAIVSAVAGSGTIVTAVLVLAIAAAIYRLIGRNLMTIVTAKEAAATIAILFVLCALGDLATDYPYQAVLFLFAAAALGFVFLLLQQGTVPVALPVGRVLIVAAPGRLIYLRMLEELRAAGILSADEFAAKRLLVEP